MTNQHDTHPAPASGGLLPELWLCLDVNGEVRGWGSSRENAINGACEANGWDEDELFDACTVAPYQPAEAARPAPPAQPAGVSAERSASCRGNETICGLMVAQEEADTFHESWVDAATDYAKVRDERDAAQGESKRLREALADAATSLETIARDAGRPDTYMEDRADIRGYANGRACVAKLALTAHQPAKDRSSQ